MSAFHSYDLTLKVSDTLYIITNVSLYKNANIQGELYEAMASDDILVYDMACKTNEKYEKYWDNCEKTNLNFT